MPAVCGYCKNASRETMHVSSVSLSCLCMSDQCIQDTSYNIHVHIFIADSESLAVCQYLQGWSVCVCICQALVQQSSELCCVIL